MQATLRTTLALLVGIAVTFLTISAVEQLNHLLYPLPAGLDWQDSSAVAAHLRALPVPALLLVLVGWSLGILTGMSVATAIAGRPRGRFALACGSLVTVGAVANFYLLPHPQWLVWLSLFVLPLLTVLGWRLLRLRYLRLLQAKRNEHHE